MKEKAYRAAEGFYPIGDWPYVDFVKLYKRTRHIPHELDKMRKGQHPIALFVQGVMRGSCYLKYTGYFENGTKEYFGISTSYRVSAN